MTDNYLWGLARARALMQSQPAKIKVPRCDLCGEVKINGLCKCPTTTPATPENGAQPAAEGKRTRHVMGCGYPYFECTCSELEKR